MITGDYPATARAIAQEAGIAGTDVMTGEGLADSDDQQLAAWVRTTSVFTRIMLLACREGAVPVRATACP